MEHECDTDPKKRCKVHHDIKHPSYLLFKLSKYVAVGNNYILYFERTIFFCHMRKWKNNCGFYRNRNICMNDKCKFFQLKRQMISS